MANGEIFLYIFASIGLAFVIYWILVVIMLAVIKKPCTEYIQDLPPSGFSGFGMREGSGTYTSTGCPTGQWWQKDLSACVPCPVGQTCP